MKETLNCPKCANNSFIDYPNNSRPCNCWRGKLEALKQLGKEHESRNKSKN